MFKSFVLGSDFTNGHSVLTSSNQNFRGLIKKITATRFPNDGAKVLLFVGKDWEYFPNFVRILSELSALCFSQTILVRFPSYDFQ